MIHRSAPGLSACSSHLRMAQKTRAVKKAEEAYTSPSTALYQNESVKAYASAPTTPQAMIVKTCRRFGSAFELFFWTMRRAKCVMDQKRNRIDRPLAIALMKLTARAAVCGLSPNRIIKKRPISTKSGAPGGWGIWIL